MIFFTKKSKLLLLNIFFYFIANGQDNIYNILKNNTSNKNLLEFINKNADNNQPSISTGTVSKGNLVNGKLIPFKGENFQYFDTSSYLNERAFVNDKLKNTVIQTYFELDSSSPARKFYIMECSNKNGGKIFPHRTHQNGLSIDFMMPLIKNNKPYYKLDSIGGKHYLLDFDNNGHYEEDMDVMIDFNMLSKYILILEKNAKRNGLKISKVIIKTEFIQQIYKTYNGPKFKNSNIYLTTKLEPIINSLHDDHFHVDFELIKINKIK